MDISLISFIAILGLFFISIAIFKISPLMAIAGGIIFIIIGSVIMFDGIDLMTGKSGTYAFNLTTSNEQIQGNLSNISVATYTNHKDILTNGLGLIALLSGLSFIYLALDQNRRESNE